MDIYNHFSCYENLPVRIADVIEHVLETKVVAAIEIFAIDIDPARLQGFCWQFIDKPHNSLNHHRHAWICYSKHLPNDMARLVICKELLHLLDDEEATAKTREQVSELIEQIVLPVEGATALGLPALTDHNGMLRALAVMMPACAIEALREKLGSTISYETIAKLVQLPERWVRFAFSGQWKKISDMLGLGVQTDDPESPTLDL